jgi:hypothetical protein
VEGAESFFFTNFSRFFFAEKLKEIEPELEDVEGAEPPEPAQIVKLEDQKLVLKLGTYFTCFTGTRVQIMTPKALAVGAIQGKAGDAALWAEVLAGLRAREAGALLEPLEEGAQEMEVEAVVSYHFARANALWGAELKRITDANTAEISRLKAEAEQAAADAAVAEDE